MRQDRFDVPENKHQYIVEYYILAIKPPEAYSFQALLRGGLIGEKASLRGGLFSKP